VRLLSFSSVEEYFLVTPAQATSVTVVRIENSLQTGEGPLYFRYAVTLPDGSQGRLWSEHLFKAGTRLSAMISRGRLTGRTIVKPPYRLLEKE